MNKLNINQTGGFGLKTQRLTEMQTAYEIFNAFGYLAGNLTIVSGCVLTGTVVSDGFVFINGELFPFKSAYVSENVVIIENITAKEFENGEIKNVHYERYVTFGTAETSWPWADFIRPIQTKQIPTDIVSRLESLEKKAAIFQSGGGMVFWNKPANEIPEGWQEVINWRGRMPVGMDITQTEFNTLGKQGGAKSRTLTAANTPKRFGYSYQVPTVNATSSGTGYGLVKGNVIDNPISPVIWSNDAVDSFSILNPYRTVLFIEFIE